MSQKPIFVATHPRACSTAFERVFMTQKNTMTCAHEPFGDAWYFGPERLGERYHKDKNRRTKTGFNDVTYRAVLDGFETDTAQGKRLFVKDMAYCLCPPKGLPASIAPSLSRLERGVGTNGSTGGDGDSSNGLMKHNLYPYGTEVELNNPTVIPEAILRKFHLTFLIRHPRSSIPSYYRCCIPPLAEVTGFHFFDPSEAGYAELRRLFDYLRSTGQIGPESAGRDKASDGDKAANGDKATNGQTDSVEICVVDADDLLDNPSGVIEAYCKSTGVKYDPGMLEWDEADQQHAKEMFEKWNGFHEDAIHSSALKPRIHLTFVNGKKKKTKSPEEEDAEWREKYGEKGAKLIRETVDANIADYEYLKQFALRA